ncbi:MAG: DegT/DnrJ/EryC1/StrS family aminotransferase [Planctomycetota bacterium]
MPKIPLVDLQTQSRAIKHEVLEKIGEVIDSSGYILGAQVSEFEDKFAEYCGARHAIGLANGTEALHMALRALDIGEGDEVITAGNSFAATAFAIRYSGATPVFVDIQPDDFNLDPSLIESAITPRTKAIMPVHLYGQPARMDAICQIAKQHGLRVIEDAAQGHGAELNGQRCGSFGDIACFSFYPGKNLGAFGDGGAAVTNDAGLAEKLRLLRNYGQKVKNRHDVLGFNCRLDTVQAAVLLVKMKYIEGWTESRRQVASWYRDELGGSDLLLPHEHQDVRHVYHLFVIRTPERDALIAHMAANNIFCGIHYPNPLYVNEPFSDARTVPLDCPVVTQLSKEIVSLPMFPEMTREQVRMVARAAMEFSPLSV